MLTPEEQRMLLVTAARAIAQGCRDGGREEPAVDPLRFPPALRELAATFVTLRRGEDLRGCCGYVVAREPLVVNVARSARAAAFHDDRFTPVEEEELSGLDLHVSILTPPEPIPFTSEADLLARLRPGRDGVILKAGPMQGLFLPAMWGQLPEPRRFLAQLKRKAGLPANFWSDDMEAERFGVAELHGKMAELLGP